MSNKRSTSVVTVTDASGLVEYVAEAKGRLFRLGRRVFNITRWKVPA